MSIRDFIGLKHFFIFIIVCFMSVYGECLDTIKITEDFSFFSLGKLVEYSEHKDGIFYDQYDIEEISKLDFQVNTRNAISLNKVENPFWFRFPLKNNTNTYQQLILEIQNPKINRIQFLIEKEDTLITFPLTGDLQPFSFREIESRHFAFPLKLAPNESLNCYLLLDKPGEPLITFLNLWEKRSFYKKETSDSLIIGGFIGFSCIIIIFALIAAIGLRSLNYWLYTLYFLFLLITLIADTGYAFQYLFPNTPEIIQYLEVQALGTSILILTIFVRLNLKKNMNILKWDPILYSYFFMKTIGLVVGIFYFFIRDNLFVSIIVYASLIITIITYLLTCYLTFFLFLKRKTIESLVVFLAMLHILLASTVIILTNQGYLPYSMYASEFIIFWVFFETVFIAIIMLIKVIQSFQDKANLKKSLLEERKKVMDQFFKGILQERQRLSHDLHDGIGLKMILIKNQLTQLNHNRDENSKNYSLPEIIKLVEHTSQDIRNFSHALGSITLQKFGLVAAIEDLVVILKNTAPQLVINIDIQLPTKKKYAEDVETFIFYIIQELLNNVIKHAQANKVLLTLKETAKQVELQVLDNGIGYDPSKVREGVGLQSIRSRALLMKGEFKVIPNTIKGVKHLVNFPIPTTHFLKQI